MSQQIPIVGDENQMALTRKAMEDAAADARHLMAHSKVISTLVFVDIIARQLFLMTRAGIQNEIVGGWEVENPDLVIQTLGMSAQEKAVSSPMLPSVIRQHLLDTVLPVVDIYCQREAEHNEQRNKPNEPSVSPVSGSEPGSESGLGELSDGATSDPEHKAGEPSEGNPRETSQA